MSGPSPRMLSDRQGREPELHDCDWLVGGGEMGELIRSMDWSATPLGPLWQWPHSLRTTVSLCLSSNFPINILWGPGSNQIYNDGYRVIAGDKHPAGMGTGYKECWESAWPEVGPPFERAWAGESSFLENQRMFLTRSGYLEETFFTFSLSPIRDEHGRVAGLFHPVTETTAQVLSERRTRALRELAANTSEARTIEAAFKLSVDTFAGHPLDLPFVLLYSLSDDGAEARLVSSTGIEPGLPASPAAIRLGQESCGGSSYPLAEMLGTDLMVAIPELKKRFGDFACGPYPEGANLALGRALRVPGVSAPVGIIIAGISPRLPLHLEHRQEYRDYVEQVASGTATALGNALAYEQLAALDHAKTQFFSDISHEFRTPLTLMLGPLEDALADAGGLPPKLREQLKVAERNSVRLLRLVNALLDFSRIEAGRARVVYQPIDLGALTAELSSNFRSATERAGLRLTIDCSSPLPEPVFVDAEMWEKVVLNLLSNAFKFTLEGGITVRLVAVEGGVEFSVSDTGIGIPERELPHLFERFYRVEGAQGRTHEGTGIGLALVQELVKLHGGSVTVESTVGEGSTFRVRIPLGAGHLPPEQVSGARELVSTAVRAEAFVAEAWRWLPEDVPSAALLSDPTSIRVSKACREKVLFVDDNADMRDYARGLLAGRYEVLTASNGEEGFALALRYGPDLVLTNLMMPVRDGMDLLQALRSRPETSAIPVIFLSARAGEEARSEGMEAGADDYLVKPFGARELLARVGAHLRIARIRKEGEQALRASEERLRALVTATSYAIYRMSPDWGEMRELEGQGFLSDTAAPNFGWLEQYIHGEDQPEVLAAIQGAIASRSLFELEHRVRRADGSIGWTLSRAVPLLDTKGEITEWVGSASDITARRNAEEALRASEERFRLMVENVKEYALFQTAKDGTITSWNPGAERLFGYGEAEMLGRHVSVLLTPEDRQARVLDREIARVLAGEHAEDARWMVRRDGSRFWAQWVTEPVHDEAGQLRGVAKVLRDETERKRAEEQQLLLMGELNHRVKNTLATVQSMANQSLRGTPSPEEFVACFKGRIRALSRAHSLLTRVSWEAAEVADVIREQLTLDGDAERISLQGTHAVLAASSSLAFALVLHELGTNARKYGALSAPQGRLIVTWKVVGENGQSALHLNWLEEGGPPVHAPKRVGFGTTLIAHSLRGVGGQTRLEFAREGLRCHIELPLATQDQKEDQQRRRSDGDRQADSGD